jgi:UDPglucose--hexose-1-phosphate uridylyltransferase
MDLAKLKEQSHRRYNPLTGEWILVSPYRTKRPWQGRTERNTASSLRFDPECYLCPGNVRACGHQNPNYTKTFFFDNDFAALRMNQPDFRFDEAGKGLLVAEAEEGICRVVCFSPLHDLTLPRMTVEDIQGVVDMWVEQYVSLGNGERINYVQIFENRGEMMGCSNPHPHCQIWATSAVPDQPRKEQNCFRNYLDEHRSCMLCDYLELEQSTAQRVVCSNEHFTAVVPFWAAWPFETIVMSNRHVRNFEEMIDSERVGLADILKRLTTRYDNLFEVSFPYSMGFHQCPTDGEAHAEWHFHAHFFPPLLRSATIRKFMVGYEMLAEPQRDITPESAADRLQTSSEVHYTEQTLE